jgi:alpha-beta hydrolase superfamily lysophospholipase
MIDVPDLPPVRVVERPDQSALCNSTEVLISPSGQYVVAWNSPARTPLSATMSYGGKSYASVAELPCLLRSKEPCPVQQLILPMTFRSVSWTADSQIVLVPGEGSIKHWRPGTTTVQDALPAIPLRDPINFSLSGVMTLNALEELRDLTEFNADFRVGPVSYWRGGWYGAFLDRRNHRLSLTDHITTPDEVVPLKMSARFVAERGVWAHDRSGQSYLVSGGAFHRIDDGVLTAVYPELVDPEPIYDAANGDILGAYDDMRVRFLKTSDEPSLPAITPDHAFYSSIAVNSSSATFAYVLKRADGGHQLGVGQAERTAVIDCESTPFWVVPAHRIGAEEWGQPERRLPVRTATLDSDAKGTVVIWLGGPGETVARGGVEIFEQVWLRRGYSVVTVEGSGALGPELGERLRDNGVAALVGDGRAAAAHIMKTMEPNARIVVEGSSLGAIAASTMAAELDRLRDVDGKTPLVLVAPWLVYRDPAHTARSYDFRRPNADFARLSEAASFGDMRTSNGTGFADAMEAWRASFMWHGPILAQFGKQDIISQPNDLWAAARASRRTTINLAEGGHQLVGSGRGAGQELEEWLASVWKAVDDDAATADCCAEGAPRKPQ